MSSTPERRSYDASRRREKARATRRSVILAARDEFEAGGYQTTTIAAVARRAGVSAETVYKSFGNKPTLAKAVFDFVIAGDDEPVPVAARADAAATQAEPDVRRKIATYSHDMAARQARSGRVQIAIRDGRTGDPEIGRIWQTLLDERLTGMTMLGRHLLGTGQLRPGVELDEVRDVLWTYIAVELYELLVLERGWSVQRYADWIALAITAALCDP